MFRLTPEEIYECVSISGTRSIKVTEAHELLVKATLKKVIEVGDEPCTEHGNYVTTRWACPICFPYLIQQLREEAGLGDGGK